ncbi:ABC transporter permease [Gemmobacter fulvus]|uniref:ABC transporter permease n=1 Tax=Gemmobacter fulvus TaxID=2840474 RepID=UPI00279666C9|nr:ABC transporter permease [Gemmobacter fulvus]MDQ1850601.1 ABC transporter permease [Gemmobacter fulvus]
MVTATAACVLALIVILAVLGPLFSGDPLTISPIDRLQPPSSDAWLGNDHLGRDILARLLSGARVSLAVGSLVVVFAISFGVVIGLLAGYFRLLDAIIMRVIDGMMAIPAILLAISLSALAKPGLLTVVVAITIPEIPRVARLVRSIVLSARELSYVEAAIASGTPTLKILRRHITPNTYAPLTVQATYVFASAVMFEAYLSFLSAGVPPHLPTWGNMISDGRLYFTISPWIVFVPGLTLAIVVLSINLIGDWLRDQLDPRIARNI